MDNVGRIYGGRLIRQSFGVSPMKMPPSGGFFHGKPEIETRR